MAETFDLAEATMLKILDPTQGFAPESVTRLVREAIQLAVAAERERTKKILAEEINSVLLHLRVGLVLLSPGNSDNAPGGTTICGPVGRCP